MEEKGRFSTRIEQGPNNSLWLLMSGSVCCFVTTVTTFLALTMPYWVHVTDTIETTVAGLTDATEVTYFYGLLGYCLRMKATHLERDDCGSKPFHSLRPWEQTTLVCYAVSLIFLTSGLVCVVLNLTCWNKLSCLILSTLSIFLAATCQATGVSLYQIKVSALTLDIGSLATASFEQRFLGAAFWLGFTSAILSMFSGLLLMLGTFIWKKPKSIKRNFNRKTVWAKSCPHKGRQAIVSVIQV